MIEILEGRLQPGETFSLALGWPTLFSPGPVDAFSTTALGTGDPILDTTSPLRPGATDAPAPVFLVDSSVSPSDARTDSSESLPPPPVADLFAPQLSSPWEGAASVPYSFSSQILPPDALPLAATAPTSGSAQPSAPAFLGGTQPGAPPSTFVSADLPPLPSLAPGTMAFDRSTGLLGIRGNGGDNTIREAVNAHGYVEVTLNGDIHSADPASAFFDPALATATADHLAGLTLEQDGGNDTLTLASQQLPADFVVQAPGAEVVTQDLTAAGRLSISASTLTITGSLHASTVSLAADHLTNIETAATITAAQLDATAPVFVNTGQIHADGAAGGDISIRAGNMLNAGQITADGTAAPGGAVQIQYSGSYIDSAPALVSANGAAGPGGQVIIAGGSTGHFFASGRHETRRHRRRQHRPARPRNRPRCRHRRCLGSDRRRPGVRGARFQRA
jgi:hypothetical protein